jgi:hypothetical protein
MAVAGVCGVLDALLEEVMVVWVVLEIKVFGHRTHSGARY